MLLDIIVVTTTIAINIIIVIINIMITSDPGRLNGWSKLGGKMGLKQEAVQYHFCLLPESRLAQAELHWWPGKGTAWA